jgi:Na+/H+-dicarboxylate symporter
LDHCRSFAVRDFQELAITYFKFFGSFLIGISSLWIILVGYIFRRMTVLLKRIVSPLIIAFGTTSSEAVFPKLTEELERLGVKTKSFHLCCL